MDDIAIRLVESYITQKIDPTDKYAPYETYIVWKCKTLQNWKYLISTSLLDGMYYELTYNGDKNEWYLDAYRKMDNQVITL